MHSKRLAKILSNTFEPWRVFIALMLAAFLWLAPALFEEQPQPALASSLQQDCRVCADWNETCDNNGCRSQGCASWVWEPCEGGDTVPLSISGSITCTSGSAGWCVGNTWLSLATSGGDGQLLISGDVDGEPFICPAGDIACSVLMGREGLRAVNYRVDSSTGNSASGAMSYQLDATSPQMDGTLSGAGGMNGWFVSEVEFSATASDVLTGIAAFEIAVNDGGYQPYAPVTLTDGVHTVFLRAYDSAGNSAEITQTVQVDTLTPLLDVSVSGAAGKNGWYVSRTEVTATATDMGSGLVSLEVSLDGGAWSIVHGPLSLPDGLHSLQFRAIDNAGNVTTVDQEVKVDTITPALNVSLNGKKGLNGWHTSLMHVLAEVNDSVSGIDALEVSLDGGAWSIVHGPLSLSDGFHSWQFRVKDKAGNQTETPVQSLKVDTIAPFIDMPETLFLGETLYYILQDDGSGLTNYRSVIEDDAEKYQKLSWSEMMSGNEAQGEILWDGKFKDGTKAKPGEYFITLKISDAAGNETMKTSVVSVNLLNALLPIQSFTPPQNATLSNEATNGEESPAQSFGGTASGTAVEKITTSTSGGGQRLEGKPVSEQTFSKPSETAAPISTSNILWGAAATALLGATIAEWQRKREEEAARRIAEEEGGGGGPSEAQRRHKSKVEKEAKQQREFAHRGTDAKLAHMEESEGTAIAAAQQAKRDAANEKRKQEETQQKAMEDFRREERESYVTAPKEEMTSWWQKGLDWIDGHQPLTALAVGIGVGLAAATIVLTGGLATPLVAAAWIAGAAVVAGGTVALGTVRLNVYYDRPLGTNVLNNTGYAAGAALLTSAVVIGAGLAIQGGLLTQAATATGNAIAGVCATNPAVCANAGVVLDAVDKLEETALIVQLTVETAIGNPNAGETAIELQLEQMDGGAPGNAAAAELGEQLAKLGDDVPELIATYGDDIIPMLLKYQDDAVDIIGAYGDEGISLLLRFGDDTDEAIYLVNRYGVPAMELLDTIDLPSANKLLTTLDDDVLDYAMKQNKDAVYALSRWTEEELKEFGPELALRAKKDADALKSIRELIGSGSIDPKKLTDEQKALIQAIAENSMQYTEEGQIVLGKWVDYGNGFTRRARETGSVHYNPHPDMWNLLGELGNAQRDSAAWLVNKQVIQTGIDRGLPFEYSLEGVPFDDLYNEQIAIQTIFSGGTDKEIMQALNSNYIPIRIRELQELQKAGYKFTFDEINNSFILSLP